MKKSRPVTIFLAEDNPDHIEIARRAFKLIHTGATLLIARDGAEALQVLKSTSPRPDFALLDINLPKLTGLQVLAELHADKKMAGMPIVMMSSSGAEEDVRKSYELGASSYIQKPVEFDKFVEAMGILADYWFEVVRLPRAA